MSLHYFIQRASAKEKPTKTSIQTSPGGQIDALRQGYVLGHNVPGSNRRFWRVILNGNGHMDGRIR